MATGTAGNMPKINSPAVRQLPIAVPPLIEIYMLEEILDGSQAQRRRWRAQSRPKRAERHPSASLSSARPSGASWFRMTRPMSQRACCWAASGPTGRASRRGDEADALRMPSLDDRTEE